MDQRCIIVLNAKREVILQLQRFFHQHNALVQLFKFALDRMPFVNHKIVVRAAFCEKAIKCTENWMQGCNS